MTRGPSTGRSGASARSGPRWSACWPTSSRRGVRRPRSKADYDRRDDNVGAVMTMSDMARIARELVAPGKGILAADESSSTIKRRFDAIGVESTEQSRRDYREMLFRTPGSSDYISGVILYDETIRQEASDGTPLVKVLQDQGIHPGIKVDLGAKPLANRPGETITEGLDGLRERFAEYKEMG